MSPKLPVLSGEKLIKVPGKFGYEIVRWQGSRVRLRKDSQPERLLLPLHEALAKGTLKNILSDSGISMEELTLNLWQEFYPRRFALTFFRAAHSILGSVLWLFLPGERAAVSSTQRRKYAHKGRY